MFFFPLCTLCDIDGHIDSMFFIVCMVLFCVVAAPWLNDPEQISPFVN